MAFPANLDPLVTSRTSPGFGLSRHEVVLIGTGDEDQKKAACASGIAGKPKVEVNKSSAKSKKCKLFVLTLVTFDG